MLSVVQKALLHTSPMDFVRISRLQGDSFEGTNLWSPLPGYPAFGGQIAAQSLASAFETVAADSVPTTMSILFVNRCKPAQPVRYDVRRLRDGGIVDMRQVECYQDNALVSTTHIGFSRPDNNSHDYEAEPYKLYDDVFVPFVEHISKSLGCSSDKGGQDEAEAKFRVLYENMAMMLNVLDVDVGMERGDMRQIRIRIRERPQGIAAKGVLVALISDILLVETALMASSLTLFSSELSLLTSLSHMIHFVNLDREIDGYIYYVVRCKEIRNYKAICEGHLVHADGALICVTGQQGVFRVKPSYSKRQPKAPGIDTSSGH